MGERIQKVLARAGFGSRREIEGWIRDGRVRVGGSIAKLGDQIEEGERVSIDGRRVELRPPKAAPRVIAYHKPEGEICTRSDPAGRPTIFDKMPVLDAGRWVSVGRLDLNTSGLILLTNDGELANKLMHPSSGVEREYAVRVLGQVTPAMVRRLLRGVRLKDGAARFERLEDAGGRGANHWFRVTIMEGRNRAVRRLWESQGVKVSRLIRLRYGSIHLPPGLRCGRWEELRSMDVNRLVRGAGGGGRKGRPPGARRGKAGKAG